MARSFNGSTEEIGCGTSALLQPAAMTAACWIYPTSLTPAYSAIISKNAGTGSNFYQLFVKSNGKVAVYLVNGNYDGTGSHTLTTSNWYHVGFTYSSAAGGVGYVSGASDGTFAANGAISFSANPVLELANDLPNAGRFYGGRMADVAIWNVALTAGEFAALASGQRPNMIRRASLLAYWPLDGLASPEPDFSGNGNNGTLTGVCPLAAGPPATMFTPRGPPNVLPTSAAPTSIFRKTASRIGTRTGTRQTWAA